MIGYVALGSNLGDRRRHLASGLDGLVDAGVVLRRVSSLWESDAVDAPHGSGRFLNMVAEVDTTLEPHALLERMQSIEAAQGRRRDVRNAPRELDLDLLLLGELSFDTAVLTLPHPRMWQRRFVLEPLAEIAPSLVNAASGRSVAEELACLDGGGNVVRGGRLPAPKTPLYNPTSAGAATG